MIVLGTLVSWMSAANAAMVKEAVSRRVLAKYIIRYCWSISEKIDKILCSAKVN